MDTVLDLDLDFFGWPPIHEQEGQDDRPANSRFVHFADETEVRSFLERQCHLKRNAKIPGRQFVEHVDAFRTWREWLLGGKLTLPFAVVHIDGHADLGAGLGTYLTQRYIEVQLLALPVVERASPRFDSRNGINSANYLVAAIGNQWVSRLTYVQPSDPNPVQEGDFSEIMRLSEFLRGPDGNSVEQEVEDLPSDLPHWCFQNRDYTRIQLAHRQRESDRSPVRLEPPIPFEWKTGAEFEFSGFTRMVVAQSPQYTPASADRLLPIISDYFVSD